MINRFYNADYGSVILCVVVILIANCIGCPS